MMLKVAIDTSLMLQTPLHVAVEANCNPAVVDLLVKAGAALGFVSNLQCVKTCMIVIVKCVVKFKLKTHCIQMQWKFGAYKLLDGLCRKHDHPYCSAFFKLIAHQG